MTAPITTHLEAFDANGILVGSADLCADTYWHGSRRAEGISRAVLAVSLAQAREIFRQHGAVVFTESDGRK